MKNIWFKTIVRSLFFRPGSVRTICFGPMQGMVFRVSHITGLSPWYSGVERKHHRTFDSLIWPGDVVVDIGANWGLHTLYLSRLVGQNGLVVSIEPFPTNFAELEWHIQINDCRNVKALPIAISNADEEELFVPGGSPSTGSLASISSGSSIQGDPILVTAHKLDSVVKELGIERLKLVKIDVEGAEGKVLLGAQKTIESLRPYFVIDLHTPEQDVFVAQLLTSHKYKLQRLSGPPILRTDVGWPDPKGVWGSILGIPSMEGYGSGGAR
jgi:FkbM family methyltransferase